MRDSYRRAIPAFLLSILLAGSAAGDPPKDSRGVLPEDPIPEAELLTLEPAMAKFLIKKVGRKSSREARLNGLLDAMFSKRGLDIQYGNSRTKTAAETFEDRSGNCLSFTFLFVAMARHLGLEAYFMEVDQVLSWDRRNEIVVSNRHMFAEVELDNGKVQVDFLPEPEKRYHAVRRISDARALAHYYNNLGAERLTHDEPHTALAYFRKALDTDSRLSQAMVNQGFAYRRLQRFDEAESSYLQALETEGSHPVAASNLASLYLTQGRRDEAAPYVRRAEGYQQRNPFHHYRLGLQRVASGDHVKAIEHLKNAIRRDPKAPDFHITLSESYVALGDRDKAIESLRKAIRLTEDRERKAELRQRREALSAGLPMPRDRALAVGERASLESSR